MSLKVSVLTPRGSSAIGVLALWGKGADDAVGKCLGKQRKSTFRTATRFVCLLEDKGEVLDEVVAGKLGDDHYHICSHGNPLIIKSIVSFFCRLGAEAVELQEYFSDFFEGQIRDIIGMEAAVAKTKSVTIEGVKYIDTMEDVLRSQVKSWLKESDVSYVRAQIKQMLDDSRGAMTFVCGARVILAGEPNSGKSTLLNSICRKNKALVTDIAGTTRDYVSSVVWTGKTEVELIDTAGLDDAAAGRDFIDRLAQDKTMKVLDDCDVVLNVIDASKDSDIRRFDCEACVVYVLNKSDLGVYEKFLGLDNSVQVSAKFNKGIEDMVDLLHKKLGLMDESLSKGGCFSRGLKSQFDKALKAEDILNMRNVLKSLLLVHR